MATFEDLISPDTLGYEDIVQDIKIHVGDYAVQILNPYKACLFYPRMRPNQWKKKFNQKLQVRVLYQFLSIQ